MTNISGNNSLGESRIQPNKLKIINDPVFGFINIPDDFLYEIIQHPYF